MKYLALIVVASALLAVGLPASASPATSRVSITPKPTLQGVSFYQTTGALANLRKGQRVLYTIEMGNARHTSLMNLRIDIFVPKQTVMPGSLYVSMPTTVKTIVGTHVRIMIARIPGRLGPEIGLNTRLPRSATGMVCDKMMLTYAGKTYDYSPACVSVIGPPV